MEYLRPNSATNEQSSILPMQEEEEWWLEGRPLHSASGAVPGLPNIDSDGFIVSDYRADQSLYPSEPHLDSFVPFHGGMTPNDFPVAPNVSSLTSAYNFDHGRWDLPNPEFPSHTGSHVTMNDNFYPMPNSYNSTSSPYASNSHDTYSSWDMEPVAETSQPTLANGTNLTALSANTGRQRFMKTRSTCKACRKSFSRPSDLNRHAKKHQPGARIYTCSISGCDYEGSYRKDKLAAHVKNCHA